MDNLTHTLIGTLVGETFAQVTATSGDGMAPARRRNLLVAVAAVSSNLPDLDSLCATATGDKLGYLLQHRGYTHTVIGALITAIVVSLACEGWCRWRRWTLSANDRVQIGGVTLLTLLLHIAMDFTNTYGVHPFWPFYNGWLYGDTVFIVEPLLWVAAVPLIVLLRTRVARWLVGLAIAAGIAIGFSSGLVPAIFVAGLALLGAAMLVISHRTAPRNALFAGVAVGITVIGMFAGARSVASQQISAFVAKQFDTAQLIDDALTPMPANPLCWEAILVLTQADRYLIRHATWSIAPSLIPAQSCPSRLGSSKITAPVVAMQIADNPSVHWRGEIDRPRNQIARLAATNCEAAAFMRFARVPWSMRQAGHWLIGDLRYDREPGLGFAELQLSQDPTHCRRHVPPWVPPRKDLMR